MVSSAASTVAQYLAELPAEQRHVVSQLRTLIHKHLPKGYEEAMNWGMITYQVPLSRFADTYNGKPLAYAAIAAQKRHFSLYLMCAYANSDRDRRIRAAYEAAGIKLDMGKSCIRFQSMDELLTDVIGEVIASVPVDGFIAEHQAVHAKPAKSARKARASDR